MEKIMDKKLCEKLTFLYGKDNWSLPKINGIDTLRMSDGPHGLRYVYKEENWIQYSKENRAYPSLSTLANSWNKDVLYSIGECIALDCIEENVDIILAPGVNLKRHPFCGRNFEYISEDSYLAGKLGASYIKGVQDKGVVACIKHYACNNRERDRFFESSEVELSKIPNMMIKKVQKFLELRNKVDVNKVYDYVVERGIKVITYEDKAYPMMLKNISRWKQLPEQVEISQEHFLIGRGSENQFILPVVQISNSHARIDRKQEQLYITDLASTNGVFLNGKRLVSNHPVLCREKDIISFGDISYQLWRCPPK